jgi:hypothetical protein
VGATFDVGNAIAVLMNAVRNATAKKDTGAQATPLLMVDGGIENSVVVNPKSDKKHATWAGCGGEGFGVGRAVRSAGWSEADARSPWNRR